MYWNAIIWLITWPLLIVIAWFLVQYVLTKHKGLLEKAEE